MSNKILINFSLIMVTLQLIEKSVDLLRFPASFRCQL